MRVFTRILQAVLGVVFLGAGGSKLAGTEKQVESFTHFGLPSWFRRLIGSVEVLGGIGMFVGLARQRLAALAAIGITGVLLGAIGSHLRTRDAVQHLILPVALLGINALVGVRAALQHTNG